MSFGGPRNDSYEARQYVAEGKLEAVPTLQSAPPMKWLKDDIGDALAETIVWYRLCCGAQAAIRGELPILAAASKGLQGLHECRNRRALSDSE